MKQLFYSLITNSVQHSKRDGLHEITIGSKEITQKNTPQLPVQNDAELIEIMIQDNGAGFSKQQLEKIFDIFPNLINEELEKSDGSGLVYCRKIVRNHGGSIAAESEPGQGTAFSIILPIRARS